VDGTAVVEEIRRTPREHVLHLRPEPQLLPYLIPKGSVAVDGVSLTIAESGRNDFTVALIPTTLAWTTLGALAVGDQVNIETDILVRTIVHRLAEQSSAPGLTLETLRKAGYA
jgi:riboflavin synthase